MNSRDVTLGDFVQQLLLQLGDRQLRFKDERPWHEFFYNLKTAPTQEKPAFLQNLFFDWNGEYPKSRELSEYLHALHWTGCMAAANPSYDQVKLNQDVGNLWRTNLDPDLAGFLTRAVEEAKTQLAV
jgi:hypothetical protein